MNSPPARPNHRNKLGASGEDQVLAWYEARGYVLVARNWRCRIGEIDLIVRNDTVLVFCEVKTRSSNAFGGPFAAVGPKKQKRLRSLAVEWLAEANPGRGIKLRFDVAGVMGASIEVIESAF